MKNIVPNRLLLYSLYLLFPNSSGSAVLPVTSMYLWAIAAMCNCVRHPTKTSGFICLFAFDASPQVFLWSLILTLDTNSTTYRPWLPPSLPVWPFLCLGSPEQSPFILLSVCHQEVHVLGAPRASPVKAENRYLVELGLLMPISFLPIPRIFARFQSKVIIIYTWVQQKRESISSQNAKRCFRVRHRAGSHTT